MNAGDAFFIKDRSVDTHLWVIISDPVKDLARVVIEILLEQDVIE